MQRKKTDLSDLVHEKSGAIRRLETWYERLIDEGVPTVVQAGVAAYGVAMTAFFAPPLLLAVPAYVAYAVTKHNNMLNRGVDNLGRDGRIVGKCILRGYDLNTLDGADALTDKYGVQGAAFAKEYLALAHTAGLAQLPKLMVAQSRVRVNGASIPNENCFDAGALSDRSGKCVLIIGEELIKRLQPSELRAVVAHEMTHIKLNHGARRADSSILNTIAKCALATMAVAVGAAVLAAPSLMGVAGLGMAMATGGVAVGVSAACAKIKSRYHETCSDRGAAMITGVPGALASAFKTIETQVEQVLENDRARREGRKPRTMQRRIDHGGQLSKFDKMFLEHPLTSVREAAMAEMRQSENMDFWRQRQRHFAEAFEAASRRNTSPAPFIVTRDVELPFGKTGGQSFMSLKTGV